MYIISAGAGDVLSRRAYTPESEKPSFFLRFCPAVFFG